MNISTCVECGEVVNYYLINSLCDNCEISTEEEDQYRESYMNMRQEEFENLSNKTNNNKAKSVFHEMLKDIYDKTISK